MNVTITFKGKPGTGKTTLAEITRAHLESLGFLVSEVQHNAGHDNERVVVQHPAKTIKAASK